MWKKLDYVSRLFVNSPRFLGFVGFSPSYSHGVLTAGHCLEGQIASNLRVEVGALNLYEPPNPYEQTVGVSRFTIHPDYDRNAAGFPNDIGMIFLDANVVYNANVQPATLAPKGSSFADTKCVITGWGWTAGGSGGASHLQEAHITKITNTLCRSYWGSSINDRHICVFERLAASGTRPATCNGDTGGPLMCGTNKHLLAGISSWIPSTCSGDYPSVFTRVSEFVDWINDTN